MSPEVLPVPGGYATVAPWIVTRDTAREIEFLTAAFDGGEPRNFPWGDRGGRIRDPLGNIWWLTEHIEDVEPELQAQHWADPEYIESVRYAQESLDQELSSTGDVP